MASSPFSPVTTTGRLTIASRSRIATCGWLMIGVAMIEPYCPGFVIVNVPPRTSSGVSSPARARLARSLMRAGQPLDGQLVRVADDRDDQPVLAERHGDPEVDVLVERVAIALEPALSAGARAAPRRRSARRTAARSGRALLRARPRRRAMSASIHVVHVAAVSSERLMCSPIDRRMRESGSPPARRGGSARRGRATRCAAAARGVRGIASTNASTSCLRTRPPRPVPSTSPDRCRARRRSAGRPGE